MNHMLTRLGDLVPLLHSVVNEPLTTLSDDLFTLWFTEIMGTNRSKARDRWTTSEKKLYMVSQSPFWRMTMEDLIRDPR